jgi:MFS family permease
VSNAHVREVILRSSRFRDNRVALALLRVSVDEVRGCVRIRGPGATEVFDPAIAVPLLKQLSLWTGAIGSRRLTVLPVLCVTTGLVVLGNALAWPLLAIRLQHLGYSATVIGALIMLPWLLTGALVGVVPKAIRAWGPAAVYRWGCTLEFAGGVFFAAGDSVWLLVGSALIGGVGGASLWNAGETLLAAGVAPAQRGRAIGVYQTCLGAALAVGPFLPALIGGSTRTLLWLAALMLLGAALASLRVPVPTAASDAAALVPNALWRTLLATPALGCLAFVGGVFEVGLASISAADAASRGMPLALAAGMAGAIGLGSLLAHYPAGWAADHLKPRTGFVIGAGMLFAGCAVAALGLAPAWFDWLLAGMWGAVGGCFYTLTMAYAMRSNSGTPEIRAAAVIAAYTWGATAGPLLSGAILDVAGPVALLAAMAATGGVALLAAIRL